MAILQGEPTRVLRFWLAAGCSHRGNLVKREGKVVTCGHRHKSEGAAGRCVRRMQRERPGGCQDCRAVELEIEIYKKGTRPKATP